MTITNDRCTSFVAEAFDGIHQPGDVYKMALIRTGHAGAYSHATTNVGTPGTGTPSLANLGTDEVSGPGYTAGGVTLSGRSVTISGRNTRLDFAAPSALPGSTFSADGAIIYNATRANRAVEVFLFTNAPVAPVNGSFSFTMPAVGDATSLLHAS